MNEQAQQFMIDNYAEGLYEYHPGIKDSSEGIDHSQRVILKIDGHWYLAGWEMPMSLSEDSNGMDKVAKRDIGEMLYKIKGV